MKKLNLTEVKNAIAGWPRPNIIQWARLRDFVAMMRGIPSNRVNLHEWVSLQYIKAESEPIMPSCAALACGAGWAGIYPDFNDQGFTLERCGTRAVPVYTTKYFRLRFSAAIKEFFGVPQVFEARDFCNDFDTFALSELPGISDKQLVIWRACAVLEREHIHTGEFSAN